MEKIDNCTKSLHKCLQKDYQAEKEKKTERESYYNKMLSFTQYCIVHRLYKGRGGLVDWGPVGLG